MRQTKSVLALLLTLCMLLGMLPLTVWAAEPEASLNVTSIEGKTCTNGTDGTTQTAVYGLKFTTTVPDGMKGCIVLLAYDPEKIQAVKVDNIGGVDYYQDINTSNGSQTVDCFVVTGKATPGILGSVFSTAAASWKTIDGKTTVQYTIGHTDTVTNTTETQDMFNFYYRLQNGVSLSDLTAGSIQVITNPSSDIYKAHFNVEIDGANRGVWFSSTNSDEYSVYDGTASLSVTHPGSGNKDAYTGTPASKPTVASKQGGSVTLDAQTVDGEDVEYAYGTTDDAPTSAWQDGTSFTGLPAGTYYFFARVKETAYHKAGTAVVSDAVKVFAAPSISYGAVTGTVNSLITTVTPELDGGSGNGKYEMQGTLPTGLSLDESTGAISGTPTVGGSGSVTVTYTDSEEQTATATVNYDISKMAVTTDKLTYDLTEVDYNGSAQPVTVTAKESGMGTITVKYNGSTTAPKDAGTYAITVDVAASELYNGVEGLSLGDYVIAPIQLTADDLEYTGDPITKTYDGTTDSTVNSGVTVKDGVLKGSDSLMLTVADAEYNSKDVATASKVTITVAAITEGNYRLAAGTKIEAAATITAADYTPSLSEEENQSVVVGVGTFTQPTFTGVNGEPVDGTLSYTYNTESKSYDEIVTALKALQKGDDATIEWSFTATNGNYVNTEKTGTINVTMVDIIFQVGNETAAADNALTIKQNPTYGDTWAEIVQLKENVIEASVNGDEVDGTYTLDVTGTDVPNANTHTVKVYFTATGSSQYQNVEVLSCQITVAKRTAELKWDGYQDLTYDGSEKTVTATVSNLVTGDECDVTVTGGAETNAGTYTATATGLTGKDAENYQLPTDSTAQKPYTIAPRKITFAVTLDPDSFEYDGSEKQPTTVTVKDGETELTTNDYTVTFPEDSINVNTYTVTVTGKNNYEGSTGSATYAITKQHQNDLNINVPTGTKTYGDAAFDITVTGGSGTGAVTLTSSDPSILKLEQGEDKWTATILKAGTVTLKANKAGDNNYEPADEKTVEVTIGQKSLTANDIEVTLEKNSFEYTGEAFTPAVTVKDGETTLAKGTDYDVDYTNNTNVGTTATVTVTGNGNYKDSVSETFTITAKDLTESAVISGLEEEYSYTGSEIAPSVTVKDGSKTLTSPNDYTVEYRDNTARGTATVTVNFTGNYSGSKTANFEIVAAPATGTVTISASTEEIAVDTILTANVTGTYGDLAYQWYRGDTPIDGAAGSTYELVADDVDTRISVWVTSSGNYVGTLKSAPVEVGKTVISGTPDIDLPDGVMTPVVGTKLTIDDGGLEEGDYTIQWLRDGEPIDGETGTTYTITAADKGHTISVKLTGVGDKTGEIVSDGTLVPATAPATPTVTATAGNREVTVSWTVSDNGGAPITGYTVTCKEKEDGAEVSSVTLGAATTSHTFTGLDNGKTYTFEVTATNSANLTSTATKDATPVEPTTPSGPVGGGGGGGGVASYTNTVAKTENGTVTVSPKNASKGATVTLTVTPDEGYLLDTITVTDKNGNAIEVTKTSDGKFTFKMPGSAVTVKATFAVKPDESTMPFTDVAESAWYYDAVVYVYENGMMTGTNDGTTFSPAMELSRGMMAQVLYNLEKGTAPAAGTFTDVAADAWYADAVNWAAANSIVGGYGNGAFGPEDSITREQMAVILYNYANFKGYDMTSSGDLAAFTDGTQVSDWAEYAMKWAVAEGLIQGSNNALNPQGTASRAEVAQILANFGENVAK